MATHVALESRVENPVELKCPKCQTEIETHISQPSAKAYKVGGLFRFLG